MSEFLMTTWAGAGNTPPMMSVASALVARGHSVRVLADEVLRPEVEATGAKFVPWRRAPQRIAHGLEGDFIRDWSSPDPAENFARLRDLLAVGPSALHAADVGEEIARSRPDALLVEMFLFGALVAAEATGVPAIVLNPTINVVPSEGVPPFGFGLAPARTAEDEARDREFGALAVAAWDAALPALNRARAEQGLDALEHVLDQGRMAARVLVLTSGAFDFRGPLPPVVQYVGPRLDDVAWAGEWSPPAGDDPLVLVSLSSDYQAQESLLQRLVDALAALPVRGVVTTGRGIDPARVDAPAHVAVVGAAPHSDILREAAVTVTHAGHGTTLKSLAAGVPLVCVPMGRDQLDVAARVVAAGAGVRVDPAAPAAAIAAAVAEVLKNPAYRAAAQRLAAAIADETADDRAVEEIEAVVAATPRARAGTPV